MSFLTGIRMFVFSILICCGIYPAVIWVIGQSVVPFTANGSLIKDSSGNIIGSQQIAQNFSKPEFFWPRLSAVDYNGAGAGGTNLSPTNNKVSDRAKDRLENLAFSEKVPADLLTSSGSGLDPHITLSAAKIQISRVAQARSISENALSDLVNKISERKGGSFLKERLVNVLMLNVELEKGG